MDKNVSVAIRINSNVRPEWSRRGIISSHIPANKRVTGMDEQQVLLYLSEFHRSEDPFSCATISRNRKFVHAKYAPTRKSARNWNFFEDASIPPSRNLVWRNSVVSVLDQFYLFIFFSFSLSTRIESSLHSPTLGPELLELRNYDGNHSSIRECCTNMSVPSSFPYNLRR